MAPRAPALRPTRSRTARLASATAVITALAASGAPAAAASDSAAPVAAEDTQFK